MHVVVECGCLLRKMRERGLGECLVRCTDSVMKDQRFVMSVDGQDSEPMGVTTGLPQGSPVSPVLFAIYIVDIHQAAESQVEDSRGISFIDGVNWIMEDNDLSDVVAKLEVQAQAFAGLATMRYASRRPRPRPSSPPDRGGTDDATEGIKWVTRRSI